ncbi:hypothetical protein EMIHUDRAFT_446917, partial [Emiliania huxleyi CCMP1516]|uniref:Uncharacterized protein n=2 Tax=Emiliania huxleyi TaxID=2903 RepID=A0A0D3KRZ8_EMIH1
MPKEWGSSGARLSLPLQLRFSEETADLGFPGEESMTGRTARQLCCPGGGSFVGQAGTVRVEPTGGAWSVKPTRQPGVGELRFFLDFLTEAARNDVTLPAGRVFFSGTCVDPELAQALGPTPGDVFAASPQSGLTRATCTARSARPSSSSAASRSARRRRHRRPRTRRRSSAPRGSAPRTRRAGGRY